MNPRCALSSMLIFLFFSFELDHLIERDIILMCSFIESN